MRKVYLHIGHGKTGTTSLQKWLASNPALLDSARLKYVETGRVYDAHHLFAPIGAKIGTPLFHKLRAELVNLGDRDAIISSEMIYYSKEENLVNLAKALRGMEVVIILYIRNQVDLIASTFLQWVKEGRPYGDGPVDFYKRNRFVFKFETMIERFSGIFTESKLVLRLYRGSQAGGTIQDFCNILDIPYNGKQELIENLSLPSSLWKSISIIDSLNIDKAKRNEIVNEFVKVKTRKTIEISDIFSDEIILEIQNFFWKHNVAAAEYFFEEADRDDFLASVRPTMPARDVEKINA